MARIDEVSFLLAMGVVMHTTVSFHDPKFKTPHMWTVQLWASCPKCANEMVLAGKQGSRDAFLKCQSCGHGEDVPGVTSNELTKAVLARASK